MLTRPTFLGEAELRGTDLGGHPAATAADVATLERHLPEVDFSRYRAGTILMSPVYYEAGSSARVAVSVTCCEGLDGLARAIAGVEVSLREELLRVEGVETGPQSSVFLVDGNGTVIIHPSLASGTRLAEHGAVAAFLDKRIERTAVYTTPKGRYAAAFAPVGALGWGVVVEQPEAVAYAAASRMRRQILLYSAVTIALVLLTGFLFAGRLRRVLARMMEGARAFGEGRLGRRIDVRSSDEIGELAGTMNAMASQLEASLRELEQWSLTLEARVQERTEELQQAQAQILMQSKLAAVGQLGAGVAHEVNNPLAGILGLSQLLVRDRKPGDPDYQSLKDIEAAAKRCKDITLRLLRFSERRLAGRSPTTVAEIIDEVLGILDQSLAQASVEVVREFDPATPEIVADPGQLGLVFTSMLTNARSAMPDGGTLTIATRQSGDGIEVVIRDTGFGIDKEHVDRVFEPFFTTKRTWTDVGLGLSVAHRIVADHGGRIEVESELGKGATFRVFLPAEPPEAPAPDAELPKRRTVLLE
jgi:signal transduction histidine kinase